MNPSPLGTTGLKASRIGLGTAEIGFAYGIGEQTLPTESEAIDILKRSVGMGITFFDTASYYGLAEERIGKSGILKDPRVIVETKCAQFLEKGEYFTAAELEAKIREQVEQSLAKLKIRQLHILMLHGPSAEQIKSGELMAILKKLKGERKITFTGVSTRGEESPLAAIDSGFFEVIQVAYSIADERMAARVLPAAHKAGVAVVNRSVLLKGALTSKRSSLPAGLEPLARCADAAERIAIRSGTDLPTLAIRFAASNPFIAASLIGSNKISHIKEAIDAAAKGPLPHEIISELEALAISDPAQVDPALWPKI